MDAAIIFSDILVVPQAMGMALTVEEGTGPRFDHPLRTPEDFDRLREVDVERDLGYMLSALKLARRELRERVPLIGFAGAPWTLMSYMVEGSGSKSFARAKRLLVEEPKLAHRLLERLVEQLADAYQRTCSEDWCWFEDELSYDNARLSQALLIGGNALDRPELAELGLESLHWLGDECGLNADALRLPGHHGRRRGEGAPGGGDEQPLDAAAIVEAELSAFAVTGAAEHGVRAIKAFEWFLGRNRLQRPLYDFATGGCSDGLGRDALNDNEGAESTLAFHHAALLLDAAGVRASSRERTLEAAAA